MTITEIMEEQHALQKQIDDLKSELRTKGWSCFQRVIPAIFSEHPGMKQLAIRGWTPGFNDGDPCTHSTEYYISDDMWSEYDEDEYWDSETDCYREVNKLTDEEVKAIKKALYSFDYILECQYGTDWELFISKDPESGELKWDKDHYDCGH